MVGHALGEATGAPRRRSRRRTTSRTAQVVVLGSGNLGLVYLMEEQRRLTLEEIDERHPRPDPGAARASARRLPARPLGRARPGRARPRGRRATSPTTASRATTRSRTSRRPRPHHLRRTDGFAHVADIMVSSFYDPQLDEGCAFEELISFHGGMGGPQTRPFILHPVELPVPGRADRRRRGRARPAHRLAAPAAGRGRRGVDGSPVNSMEALRARKNASRGNP